MAIKRYTKEELEKMDDLTDYDRLNNMTDEEIRINAESDPDAPPQTEKDLQCFEKVKLSNRDKS